jgi:pimeloyl-ACP methyl ester carboxylesterase
MIAFATQGPTQGAALAGTISAPAWRSKPTWFVIASNDRMISPKQEKDSAETMNAKTLTLPTSHVPMLSRPKEVAAFISDAASDHSRLTATAK